MIEIFKMVSGAYDEQGMPAIVTAEEGFYQTRGNSYKLSFTIARLGSDNTISGKW